jgi:hypothetical protein
VSQIELQQDIQRFTSDFTSYLAEAGERIAEQSEPRQRELSLRRVLIYASNALDITTGPFPEINVADMIVFVTMSRHAFDRHWQPDVFGESGQPLADALAKAEGQIWDLAGKILSAQQQAQFHELIADWERAHPGRHSVEGIRFREFSARAGEVSEERAARARGLFGSITAATQKADRALLISERAMYLAQRMPFLIRAHARLAVQENITDSLNRLRGVDRLLDRMPAAQPMLDDLVSISGNAVSAARETRLLVEAGEPYLQELVKAGDGQHQRVGARGTDDDALSLREALVRVDGISERSLALVRELRAAMPEDPDGALAEVQQRVDATARRIAIYALLVGLGWAVAFWGGYYLVKRPSGLVIRRRS